MSVRRVIYRYVKLAKSENSATRYGSRKAARPSRRKRNERKRDRVCAWWTSSSASIRREGHHRSRRACLPPDRTASCARISRLNRPRGWREGWSKRRGDRGRDGERNEPKGAEQWDRVGATRRRRRQVEKWLQKWELRTRPGEREGETSRVERSGHGTWAVMGGDESPRSPAHRDRPPFFYPGVLAENRALPYHAISPVRSEIESCSRVSRQSVTGRRTGITVIPAYSVNSEELFYSDHGGSDSGIDIPQAIPANRASSVDRIGCVDRRSSAISSVVCASRGNL